MSLHGVYNPQNIFAKIIRGEAPCYEVYGGEDVLTFLDLFSQSYGHTLVIPKHAEAHNLPEVDAQNLAKVMTVAQCPTCVLVREVQPDGVQVAQLNGAPAEQTTSHIHFHVIPRFSNGNLGIHAAKQGDPEVLAQLQEHLAQRLQG